MPDSSRARQLRELAEKGDHQGFEDLWLSTLDSAPATVGPFITGAEALASQGLFEKSGLYLSMLTPVLLERELFPEALQVLRKMAELSPRERGLRHGLLSCYRALYAENPRLEALLESSGVVEGKDLKSAVQQLDIFLGFKEGVYVFHPAGWGPGVVSEVDAEEMSIVIDFAERKGHRISMEMAGKVTEFVEPNDLRALKLDRMEELKLMCENDPVEVIRAALRSRRGKASLRDLRDRLAGPVVEAKVWSKWWQKTRTKVKSASDITITPGSNPTLELGEEAGGYADACVRDLRLLPSEARQIRYFRDLMKEAASHEDGEGAIARVAAALTGPKMDGGDLGLGPRISLGFLLSEATKKFPSVSAPPALDPQALLQDPEATLAALSSIPIAGHRVSSLLITKELPEVNWTEFCERVVLNGEPDSTEHALADLVRLGEDKRVKEVIETVWDRFREYDSAFLWYLRSCRSKKLPATVRKEAAPSLLEKALVLHSHLDVAGLKKGPKSEDKKKLAKSLSTVFPARDYSLISDAFKDASDSEAGNLAALLRNNRSLNRDLRDRMMAHMFRTRPEAAKMDAAGVKRPDNVNTNPLFDTSIMFCTERSLQQKRVEYEDVVNNQIPENAAEIGRAASYGDLSENSEWTAAIEKQERLTNLAEELREGISKSRIIDSTLAMRSESITLGSRTTITDEKSERKTYTILGPWDVNNERGFISYLSPLGRALIGAKPGQDLEVEVPSGTLKLKVESVSDGMADAEEAMMS